MKSKWPLLFLILFCTQIANSSFSHNVQDPITITNELSARLYSGDATVPLYIPTPSEISTVVAIDIEEGKEYCQVQKITAKAEKLWSYKIVSDINLDNLEWNVQIMSIAEASQKMTYVLLQNGTLLLVLFSPQKNQTIVHNYSFQSIGSTNTWLSQNHQLIYSRQNMYVLVNEELRVVSIHPTGFWKIAAVPIATGIISWFSDHARLIVLTNSRIYSVAHDAVEELGPKGSKFIDFSIYGQNYYILDEKEGILSGIIGQNNTKLLQIQYISKSVGIQAGSKVLMVIYENQGRSYLAQYLLLYDGSAVLNRYYHSYYAIKDLQIRGEYAVVDTYNGIIVMRHSVNRKSFSSLSAAEFIYEFEGARTVVAKWLYSSSSSQFQLLLGLKDQIQYLSLASPKFNPSSIQLNTLYAKCSSQKPITADIKLSYKGICSNSSFPSSSYSCLIKTKDAIGFVFAHERKKTQSQTNRFVFIFACILLVIFTILMLLGLRRKVRKALDKLKNARSTIQNRKQQHSQNMQQTFNADIVH